MTTKTISTMLLALILGAATMLGSMPADAAQGRNPLKELAKPQNGANSFAPRSSISLERATTIARQRTGGRVLSATEARRGGMPEYRIRMLVDGERVVTVVVDDSGRIRNR